MGKKWVVWQILGLSLALILTASFFSPVWAADDFGEPIQMSADNSILQRQGDVLLVTLGKNTYSIANATSDEKALENFRNMSPLQQQRFYQNRDMFIANAAKVLRRVGWTFGIGSLVANKIVMVKDKALAPFRSSEANVLKATDPTSESFKARSQRVITSILSSLNRQLWSQAPLVGDANEFGLNISLGLALEGGHTKKGWGGQVEIGLNFGYNKESKAFVFQIYRNIEKFKATLMPAVFFAGVTPKAAIQVAQTKDGALHSRVGSTVYPPGVPAFVSTTPTMFASGFNSGIGFPPPPFGDVLSYTNTLDNKALVRVTISPLLKGFVRVQFGVDLKSFNVFLQPIGIVKSWLLSLFGSGLCRGVFVS